MAPRTRNPGLREAVGIPMGTGSATIQIVHDKVGDGTCDAAHPWCFLQVNNASSQERSSSVFVRITFTL